MVELAPMRINYTSLGVPGIASGSLSCTWPDLALAAVIVGKSGWYDLLRHGRASVHEVLWRVALLRAVLREEPTGHLAKTTLYDHGLDTTEKGMVSYWLAMTTAMAFARSRLDVAWMVHVDHILRENRLALRGKRPDLIGCSRSVDLHVVEAKGRTHGFAQRAIDAGKGQLADSRYRFLSPTGATTPYVHHSYFDRSGRELAVHVEDPEPGGRPTYVPVEVICGAYYDALASTVQHGESIDVPGGFIASEFDSVGMVLGLHRSFEPALVAAERGTQAMPPGADPSVKKRKLGTDHGDLSQLTVTAFAELGTELLVAYGEFEEAGEFVHDGYSIHVSHDGALIGLDERWFT